MTDLIKALVRAQASGDREAESAAIVPLANALDPLKPRMGRRAEGETLCDRFFRRIVFGLGDCWHWRSVSPYGYGQCHLLGEQRAHRVSWRLHKGDIPAGLCVLHRCDVRNCVNPEHLFLGTYEDNNRDRNAKRRNPRGYKKPNHRLRGEASPKAKLTATDVEAIRAGLRSGETGRALALRFGVTPGAVYHIGSGRNWRTR